jgi:hypothetical protein
MSEKSIYGSIGDALLGVAGTIYQNAENRKEAERAFQRQRQLINEANIYNAPVNQMARLKEAGLNPHLIYGQGPGSMVSASAGTPPAAHQENIAENLGIYASMKQLDMQKRQLDLQERDIKLREAQNPSIIKKNEAEADKTNSEIDVNTQTMLNMMQSREHQNQLIDLNKVALTIQNDSNKFDLEQRKLLAPLVKLNQILQNQAIVSKIDADNMRLVFERELKDSRLKLDNATIKEIGSRYNLNEQSKDYLEVMNDLQLTREKIRTYKDEYNYNDWLNSFFWSCERIIDTFNPLKFLAK